MLVFALKETEITGSFFFERVNRQSNLRRHRATPISRVILDASRWIDIEFGSSAQRTPGEKGRIPFRV